MVFTLKVTGPEGIDAAFEDFSGTMVQYGIQEPTDQLFKAGRNAGKGRGSCKDWISAFFHSIRAHVFGARLSAEAPYALFVDKRVPYFSNAVEMIQRELPGLVQKAINEQAGRISRKYFGG